jgi:hypothetical protein
MRYLFILLLFTGCGKGISPQGISPHYKPTKYECIQDFMEYPDFVLDLEGKVYNCAERD